jgi:hypothetical protein
MNHFCFVGHFALPYGDRWANFLKEKRQKTLFRRILANRKSLDEFIPPSLANGPTTAGRGRLYLWIGNIFE